MRSKANGTVEMAGWDETAYEEFEGGRKLTLTSVKQKFSGEIDGEGTASWLASYLPDGTAEYSGFQRIVGSIGGREGSVLLRMSGGYDGTTARSIWSVVEGMGTGELSSLTGTGANESDSDGRNTCWLDYELT